MHPWSLFTGFTVSWNWWSSWNLRWPSLEMILILRSQYLNSSAKNHGLVTAYDTLRRLDYVLVALFHWYSMYKTDAMSRRYQVAAGKFLCYFAYSAATAVQFRPITHRNGPFWLCTTELLGNMSGWHKLAGVVSDCCGVSPPLALQPSPSFLYHHKSQHQMAKVRIYTLSQSNIS